MKTKTEFKTRLCGQFKNLLAMQTGVLLLCLAAASSPAQTCKVLHNFTGSDGQYPVGSLVLSGSTLYGACEGSLQIGANVFKVNTDGSGFVVLKQFTDVNDVPIGGLVMSGTTLYGTMSHGEVFKINTDGSNFAILKQFSGYDGDFSGDLVLSGTNLYCSTLMSGSFGVGTVFKLNTDGSGSTVLYQFTNGIDGRYPNNVKVFGNALYGTTWWGGESGWGTVFKVNTDGSGFTVIKSLSLSDGSPHGNLVLSGSTLYGTTYNETSSGGGVFKVNTDGSGYVTLHKFSQDSQPSAGMVLSGSMLYGTTVGRSVPPPTNFIGYGTLFVIDTNGGGYSVLKSFAGGDGANPQACLALSGTTLYGTTEYGGISNKGVVFSLSITPPTITTPPQSQTAEAGCTAEFGLDITSSPAPTYQWFCNGNAIAGCTNSVLCLTCVQATNMGTYSVLVSNIFGAVTSAPVMLNIIQPVERRPVPSVKVTGEAGSSLNLEYTGSLGPVPNWLPLDIVNLTNPPQYCFDLAKPLPTQRFYRAWQVGTPSITPSLSLPGMVPAITLTGNIGDKLRLDCINQIGPTDAWVTLDTVTLTNTSQLYFDTSAVGQPVRLYRIVPAP